MKDVVGNAGADASLSLIHADSGAGGASWFIYFLQPRLAEGSRGAHCAHVMDGRVDCLTDDYIGIPVKISVFFMCRRDEKQRYREGFIINITNLFPPSRWRLLKMRAEEMKQVETMGLWKDTKSKDGGMVFENRETL